MGVNYLVCGLLVLLASAFIDSARGPLLPVFAQTLGLSYGQVSVFLICGALSGAVASVFLVPLVRATDERKAALLLVGAGLLICWGGFLVKSQWVFYIFGASIGALISTYGAIANLFVIRGSSRKNRGRLLSGLHFFYGAGSLVAPLAVQRVLGAGIKWPLVYTLIFPLLLVAAYLTWKLPDEKPDPATHMPKTRLLQIEVLVILTFGVYVGGEVMTSMWMTAYLVEVQGMSILKAASYPALFFVFMAATRFLCLWPLSEKGELIVMLGSLAFSVIFSVLGHLGFSLGFAAVGICGPYFPFLLARLSRYFPNRSKQLTLWIIAFIAFSLCISHLTVGRLTDYLGIMKAYRLAPVLLAIAFALSCAYLRLEKKVAAPFRQEN